MPIAAVPAYLGHDFADASPAMRFGMYIELWGINRRSQTVLWTTYDVGYEVRGQQHQEREVKYENKGPALQSAQRLTARDRDVMTGLSERQSALAATVPADSLLRLEATAIAPFTTGLGNEHPLENGFAFLNPYGLPYLAGSGVKGVLRQAARELASGAWGETHGWSAEKNIPLMQGEGSRRKPVLDDKKRPVMLSVIDVLFGLESRDGEAEHVRGALTFWDVIPQIAGNSLMVEIMTPHQSHYYQQHPAAGSTSCHDSGQPNPITFLTVPPGSGFSFHVVCDAAHLARLTPALLEHHNGRPRWQAIMTAAFEHAFQWLGFGAKTAVGYGAMRSDTRKGAGTSGPAATADESARPTEQPAETVWPNATLRLDPGRGELSAVFEGKRTAAIRGERLQQFLGALGDRATQLQKKKELKNVAVRVVLQGNLIELRGLENA